MAVARISVAEPVEASDLVNQCLSLVVSDGIPVRDAVTQVLAGATLTDDAATFLIRSGLVSVVNGHLTRMRGTDEMTSTRGRFQLNTPPAFVVLRDRADIFERVRLEGADGAHKALGAFTLADCHAFHAIASTQAVAWQTRRTLMAHAMERLERTQAPTIAALPVDELPKLRSLAEKAWGKAAAE